MVLMSVALPVGQDQRRLEIAFDRLEAILDVSALEREISVAEVQDIDLFFSDALKEGGRAVARLGSARAGTAEDDPSHYEIGNLCGETQNCSAAADLDVVGMRAQAEQL